MVNGILFLRMDSQAFCASKNPLFFVHWDGASGTISHNNSNKTSLHLNDTLQLSHAFMYIIQIIELTSYGGRVGGGGFQRKNVYFCH